MKGVIRGGGRMGRAFSSAEERDARGVSERQSSQQRDSMGVEDRRSRLSRSMSMGKMPLDSLGRLSERTPEEEEARVRALDRAAEMLGSDPAKPEERTGRDLSKIREVNHLARRNLNDRLIERARPVPCP